MHIIKISNYKLSVSENINMGTILFSSYTISLQNKGRTNVDAMETDPGYSN